MRISIMVCHLWALNSDLRALCASEGYNNAALNLDLLSDIDHVPAVPLLKCLGVHTRRGCYAAPVLRRSWQAHGGTGKGVHAARQHGDVRGCRMMARPLKLSWQLPLSQLYNKDDQMKSAGGNSCASNRRPTPAYRSCPNLAHA